MLKLGGLATRAESYHFLIRLSCAIGGFVEHERCSEIPPAAMKSPEVLSTMYSGDVVAEYESRRALRPKWHAENEAIQQLLGSVKAGSKILDAPVGTGRFLPYYKARGLEVYGSDISEDMLAESASVAERLGVDVHLSKGDLFVLPFADDEFDLVVCIRFLNLIDWERVSRAVEELTRVSGDKVIFGIRYVTPYSDLRPRFSEAIRWMTRSVGLTRFRMKRRRAVVHDKGRLTELLERAGLKCICSLCIERRWDGTDYVLMLVQKQ